MFNFLEIKREDVGKQWRNIKKFKEIISSHFFMNIIDNKQILSSNDVNYNLISSSKFNVSLEASEPSRFFIIHILNNEEKINVKFLLKNYNDFNYYI